MLLQHSLFVALYTILGIKHAQATPDDITKPDIFKPSLAPHDSDISFSWNSSVSLFASRSLFTLRTRQELQCPAGYPIQCPNLSTCCPAGSQCVSLVAPSGLIANAVS